MSFEPPFLHLKMGIVPSYLLPCQPPTQAATQKWLRRWKKGTDGGGACQDPQPASVRSQTRRKDEGQGFEPSGHMDGNSTDHSRGATLALRATGFDFGCYMCPTSLPFFPTQTQFLLKPQCFLPPRKPSWPFQGKTIFFFSVCFLQHFRITGCDPSPFDRNDVPGGLGPAGRRQVGLNAPRWHVQRQRPGLGDNPRGTRAW